MAFGLFKKIVLADHISVFVDDVFYAPAAFHWLTLVWGVIAYSIQIYFDFSGYSDIAIGCARCFGYDFRPNFDLPYLSTGISEFWSRWHISLSTWLKEYLYMPLAMADTEKLTRGRCRHLPPWLCEIIVFLCSGLWHGAAWTFVVWGGLNGLYIVAENSTRKLRKKACKALHINRQSTAWKTVCCLFTFTLVALSLVVFRADTFGTAWAVLCGIFTLQDGIVQPFSWVFVALGLLCIGTGCAIRRAHKNGESAVHGYYPLVDLDTIPGLTVFFIVCGLILGLAFTGEAPFVYFQF